jgi:hypothetical protein
MHYYQDLITKFDNSDEKTFWFGPTSTEQIEKLENILGLKLPQYFFDFFGCMRWWWWRSGFRNMRN